MRTAVARSGLAALPGPAGPPGAEGPLDPLAVLPLAVAVHGRLAVGGRADFAVFAPRLPQVPVRPVPVPPTALAGWPRGRGCLATVLAGRLVYRRR